jgi:hypothetical protein
MPKPLPEDIAAQVVAAYKGSKSLPPGHPDYHSAVAARNKLYAQLTLSGLISRGEIARLLDLSNQRVERMVLTATQSDQYMLANWEAMIKQNPDQAAAIRRRRDLAAYQLRELGASIEFLMALTGASRRAVFNWISWGKNPLPYLPRPQLTPEEVARLKWLSELSGGDNGSRSPEALAISRVFTKSLVEFYLKGYSPRIMAQQIGLNKASVNRRISKGMAGAR